MSLLLSRKTWIAFAAVVALAASSVGLYLIFRPQPKAYHPPPTQPAPVASVGSTTVGSPANDVFLTVVTTSPTAGGVGVTVSSPITFTFNLSVDPGSVQGFFSVLPAVNGAFSQGSSDTAVVFTPGGSFASASSVNVVLRKGLMSRDGFELHDDFTFSFVTQVSSRDVMFQAGIQPATLVTAHSGRSVSLSLQIGSEVPADLELQTFRATSADMARAMVHTKDNQFVNSAIDTSSMQKVDTRTPVKNGDQFDFARPDGIYLMLAADSRGQFGALWVDFSRYGVLLRQDDQKVVVAGQDLITGDTSPTFKITLYNLQDKVQPVLTGTFTGTGEFQVKYPMTIDFAVASTGGQEVIIPVSTPATNADIKVVGDLSQQAQIYITTDRPGYQKGETVRFAGTVRISNDQLYTTPTSSAVDVWTVGIRAKAALAKDGTFAGSFVMPAGAFRNDGIDANMQLFAGLPPTPPDAWSPFYTVVQALGPHAPAGKLAVTLDKSAYVASDTIAVSITGTDNGGLPLAQKTISLAIYSTGYRVGPKEIDAFPAPTTWGVVMKQGVKLQLDASGHATYSFSANIGQKTADQQITVAVWYGSGTTAATGARSAVVYQAQDEVFLLPSRSVYAPGDTVVAPFVVETRSGERLGNATMAYEFDKTDYNGSTATTTVVASGAVSTDGNGLGIVRAKISGPEQWLTLKVKGKDAAGSSFEDSTSVVFTKDPSSFGTGSDLLVNHDLTTDKIAYNVGDTAQVTVTSAVAQKVLVSVERGRIHQYRWLELAQGDTQLTLNITPDLVPGFSLMFSYFQNGVYMSEGLPIAVSSSSRFLKVTVTPDQQSYTAGQTAHLTIAVTDSTGAPVAAKLVVAGYDANMSAFKLTDQASIAGAFFTPALRGTNGSSSLVGSGNFGGRCGGGGNPEQPATTNPGQAAVWLPALSTDATGHVTIDVPLGQKQVRLAIVAATPATAVGQVEMDLGAQ